MHDVSFPKNATCTSAQKNGAHKRLTGSSILLILYNPNQIAFIDSIHIQRTGYEKYDFTKKKQKLIYTLWQAA